jgi:tetratricopeptide (TPR) repeat protein
MISVNFMRSAIVVLGIFLLFGASSVVAQQSDQQTGVLPLTTKSAEALRLVDEAWRWMDEWESAKAIEALRKAVAIDPDFAMGHQLLTTISLDPAEQVAEQQKAFGLREHASPGERLVIQWQQDASHQQLIPAITAMNDVLSQYPHDRWVVFLSTLWLMGQTQYARSAWVYEKSGLELPGLMNNAAYVYARMHQFDKAFALMDKYVAALPHSPNPQDSYGELLRLAGRYQQAIEHFRKALEIDPQFYSSAFGIADTRSLMGDQACAREEYEMAFQKFASLPELHRIMFRTREAATFVREGDFANADRAFQIIADYARTRHLSHVEADTYRQMALYQQNPKQGLVYLDQAEAALKEGANALPVLLQEEQAQVWRARVEIALRMANKEMARTTLAQLEKLSDSSSDKVIEAAYHGATGADLFSEKKYDQAISHLEEDPNNPFSLKLLATAYQKIGYSAGTKRTEETLANLNDPTLEQALVVPAFRKCYEDPACAGRTAASLH